MSRKGGRVGERATPCGATHSPLVEPDKRISRHPALLKTYCRRHAQTVARLPASTKSPTQNAGFVHRSWLFRRSVGPLAAPSQMLRETVADVRVDLAEGLAWIPKVEVVLPAPQVPVQLRNQFRDRLMALPMISHLVQLLPFLLQSFLRRTDI